MVPALFFCSGSSIHLARLELSASQAHAKFQFYLDTFLEGMKLLIGVNLFALAASNGKAVHIALA